MGNIFLGHAKCWLGYLDQALTHILAVVERAPPADYAVIGVEFSINQVAVSSLFTEGAKLTQLVDRLSKMAREFGATLFDAAATIYRGYVISCCGDPDNGIALMNEGVDAYAATDAAIWSGYYRSLLAEGYQQLGRLQDARRILINAQELAERTGERWYDAELVRRLGELDRQEGDVGAAERRFKQALAIARCQHAKLWELHAATSLARLLHEQRRSDEARAVLAPVYGWFKEGLQTSSPRRAKALLDELEGPGVEFQKRQGVA